MNAYSVLVEISLTQRICIQTPMGLKTPVWETLSWRLGGTESTNDKNRELITHLQHNIFTEFWTNSLKRWRLADNLQKNSKYTGHKEIYSGMQVDANQTIKTDVINTNERRQRGRKVIFFAKGLLLEISLLLATLDTDLIFIAMQWKQSHMSLCFHRGRQREKPHSFRCCYLNSGLRLGQRIP